MGQKAAKSSSPKPDVATILGLVVAFGGIIGGMMLEGGKMSDVRQVTAAMIVFGGTLGAVMISTPLPICVRAAKQLKVVFLQKAETPELAIEEIIGYATKARKQGIVSLEEEADRIREPFLKKALTLAVDGTDLQELRKMMELEISLEEQRAEAEAKVFECAGGYAPTIGIIGAVLGLIQVMKHIENVSEVGKGIAVAFVATVYGVGSANIFFLPAATKIKAHLRRMVEYREMTLEGVVGIVEGLNPKLIKSKLEAYVEKAPARAAGKKGKAAPAPKQKAA